ncbi:hypothetical protein [Actinomycetospora sp. NBRC 106375]|uniref:hypothetical protein n=1 Tax=Actinomycetospora sp. NBRC 106375 TaxID=3032207 RepID=UPI0025564DE4|nr:hypothetical protein [Actinomycetospora sp. NBRC 106375]
MREGFLIHRDRIRRRWVLVVLIGVVAAAGALGGSLIKGTTYVGHAALTIVSQKLTPDEVTVSAQGYIDYFNQASSQEVLRQRAGVDPSVTATASLAAGSPILYVEAESPDPDSAQRAASAMAVALRDEVDSGPDTISQLQDLQLNAGVSSTSSDALRNAATALLGGLVLGVVLAGALGRVENRIVTPGEVTDRLGLPVLATVGGRRRPGEDARGQLLRSLTGLTNPTGMPRPGALAITGPASARASKSRVAVALAGLRALQGQTTLLLQTDLEAEPLPSELATRSGVADFLAERGARVDSTIVSNGRGLLVAPPGSRRDDLFALFSKVHVQRLVGQGRTLADLVIIDAPPVESVEGQVVCSAADRALLVVEEGETRADDASSALEALGRTGAGALGVVLVTDPDHIADPGFLAERQWHPVGSPAGAAQPR